MIRTNRREFLAMVTAAALSPAAMAQDDPAAPFRTPYKYPKLILAPANPSIPSNAPAGSEVFDSRGVDDPIVFRAGGAFYMLYIGFDGIGYQTGLASSNDLVTWKREGNVGPRDPNSKYTRFNLAISTILRDKNLHGRGDAIKVDGQYLAAWHAYPAAGYESGPAVIGLARSRDLRHWTLTEPILRPEEGAAWERGGLYRPDVFVDEYEGKRTYFLYYNAKTETLPKDEGGGWHEQSGVATSTDLVHWTRSPLNPLLENGPRGAGTYPKGSPIAASAPSADARDSRFASNPYVMKWGSSYAMYYFGFNYERPGRARELLALGLDPFHFQKAPEVLIDTGAPGSIDETFAHKPSLIYHEGALYHFYCAVSGKYPNEVRGVAVARSKPW
ncbi:glycoside hydrolase family 130 protein [Terriglobus albidus]|uniref:glycoside hydrolase family 130 protein n=1 Tax=Terriglobus albidus TaxID=1592106 RepID=UPI0021E0D505|nr:hypothetical protein [Terriglobus albidus]